MCGRYILVSTLDLLHRLFGAGGDSINLGPRYNIAPTQSAPVVHVAGGARRVTAMRWGLVPGWAREIPSSKPLFNARGETVAEKASFRDAFARRRCLVPADGFYEWPEEGPLKGAPVFFHLRRGAPAAAEPGSSLFAFAGIWERWTPPGGGTPVESYAIISTEAVGFMRAFHHRMPLILTPADQAQWLDGSTAEALPLIADRSDGWVEAHPVSRRVNAVRNDDESLTHPADPDPPAPAKAARKIDDRQSSLF